MFVVASYRRNQLLLTDHLVAATAVPESVDLAATAGLDPVGPVVFVSVLVALSVAPAFAFAFVGSP